MVSPPLPMIAPAATLGTKILRLTMLSPEPAREKHRREIETGADEGLPLRLLEDDPGLPSMVNDLMF